MSAVCFTFMRHALTKYNLEGRLAGRTDIPVCEEGLSEIVENRAKILRAIEDADVILCSTMRRCRQTLESLNLAKPVIFSEALIEKDFGSATGKLRSELTRDKDGNIIGADVEPFDKIYARSWNAIQTVSTGHVFVISHGGVFTALNQACAKPLLEKPKNVIPYRFSNHGTLQSRCVPFHS